LGGFVAKWLVRWTLGVVVKFTWLPYSCHSTKLLTYFLQCLFTSVFWHRVMWFSWDKKNKLLYYYTLNSLSLFWLTKSIQWIFEISTCDFISADYTIMSRMLKVTGNHVKFAHFVLFAINEEAKHDFHFLHSMYNKTIIRFWILQKRHPIIIV